ncbi:MAG: 2-oxoglutarate dehydrogenase complex dihydrolipoyllysine-residue succinyltransferase [Alphaproteobacteria bacterium]|nr:2-oxoglutarate dehydrogenase complex dihydrolipoyllysine-residue succinyltransferase [Alphaproteobacteria bacterium]
MATEIKVPSLGESITDATVARWLKRPGELVALDEPVVELETDKVNVEVPAPAAGMLAEIRAEEGVSLPVGAVLGTIGEAGAVAAVGGVPAPHPTPLEATLPLPGEQPVVTAASAPHPNPLPVRGERERPAQREGEGLSRTPAEITRHASALDRSGPAARKLIAESGVDAATIVPTGPGERITKADVIAALAQPPPGASAVTLATSAERAPAPEPAPIAPAPIGAREVRVRMTRLRRRIAERLKAAQNTAAMLTTFNEIDMSRTIALREQWRDMFEKKHGVRLGFMSIFVKASIAALKEIPGVNAEIDGDDIVYKTHYDIGVAVGTEHGLVVPVLRDADAMSFADIEKEIANLGRKARDGKLSIEELSGGTFTISNGGIYGSLLSTPILNPPQSGILGMHKIERRPVVVTGPDRRDEKIEIRPMMYVALSYDHRIVDGREAVGFLVRVKELVEDPSRLLFDI